MDFKKFYEEQIQYIGFRNDPEKHNEYQIAIAWKSSNLLNCIKKGQKFDNILEVGCAFGELLDIMAKELKVSKVFGIDIASSNIKMAQENYPSYIFFEGTLESLNIQKQFNIDKIDIVMLSDIVEHIPNDIEFLKRISSIAKNVVFNLPLEKSFVTRNRKYGEEDTSGHLRCYDLTKALELINLSGFEIINKKVETFYSFPPHRKLFLKNERIRLKNKPLFKWFILRTLLETVFIFGYCFPIIFKKYYGSNLFCLLKPKDGE